MSVQDSGTLGRRWSSGSVERGWVIAVAVAAIVLGLIPLLAPGIALLGVALVFGVYLVVSGVFRLVLAFALERLDKRERWFSGLLGALVLVAGILTLANPWSSLVVLGIVIGLGWIVEGVASLAAGTSGFTAAPRWLPIVAGIVSIVAGVIVMIFPAVGLETFVMVAGILLLVIGVATLFLLPKRD